MNQIKNLETEKYESMVSAIARRAQEDFRKIYLGPEGSARRFKKTKDKAWIKKYGTEKVDMATLDYSELPSDWQAERKIGSQIALDATIEAVSNDKVLGKDFIERTAELLHDKWLERNYVRATDIEKSSYGELPEKEKEKDRFFARAAVEVYLSNSGDKIFKKKFFT